MKIIKEKTNGIWLIFIDGRPYTRLQVAKKCGADVGTVGQKLSKLDDIAFEEWIARRMLICTLGLPATTRVAYNRTEACWSAAITEAVGCHQSESSRRLKRWEAGEIDVDDLFAPTGRKIRNTRPKDWLLRDLQPRQSIKNIKIGTWEKQQLLREAGEE